MRLDPSVPNPHYLVFAFYHQVRNENPGGDINWNEKPRVCSFIIDCFNRQYTIRGDLQNY